MGKREKVSVIVPVYNAGEFLEKCIESLLIQDYDEKEILLVDNGSVDGSETLCNKYAEEYEIIKVWHIEKKGVGNARNKGIEESCGKYLVFVDADDYLPFSDVLSKLVSKIENSNSDIVVGNYQRLWNGKLLPAVSHSLYHNEDQRSGKFRFQGLCRNHRTRGSEPERTAPESASCRVS